MPSVEAGSGGLARGPTGWFSITGFEAGSDRLVLDVAVRCDPSVVRAMAGSAGDGDPNLVHCYPITPEDAASLSGGPLPEADWFVNACQPPDGARGHPDPGT